jgi:YVTN family beta-propeller protein
LNYLAFATNSNDPSENDSTINMIEVFSKQREKSLENYSNSDNNSIGINHTVSQFADYYSNEFQLNYPSTWILLENNSTIFVFSPFQGNNISYGDLMINSQKISPTFNLSSYGTSETKSLADNGFIIRNYDLNASKNSGWIQYTQKDLMFNQLFSIHNSKLYNSIIVYNTSIPFDNRIASNILATLKFDSTRLYEDIQLGFSVNYPSNWIVNKINNEVEFKNPLGTNLISVGFADYRPKLTLSSLSNDFIKQINVYNWTLHYASEVTINSETGFAMKLSNTNTGETMTVLYFLFDKKPYYVSYRSIDSMSNIEIEQTFDGFLKSLIVLPSKNPLSYPAIKTGNTPVSFEIDEDKKIAYIANFHSNTVSIWDMKKNKIISNITVGIRPNDVVLSPIDNQLYVANLGEGTISVIDTFTKKVLKTIPVEDRPARLSIDYDDLDRVIFVSSPANNSVIPISGESLRPFPPIPVGKDPWDMDINPFTNMLYVTANETALYTIKYTSYLSHNFDAKVSMINLSSYCTLPAVGVAVNYEINKVFSGCTFIDPNNMTMFGKIIVIDGITNKIDREIKTLPFPEAIDIDPKTQNIIVTHFRSNNISIIDGKTYNITVIPLSESSIVNYISVDPSNSVAYVIRSYSNSIAPINMSSGSMNLLAGVNFYVPSNNASKIFCGTISMDGDIKDKKPYGHGDFLMVENGTELFCEPSDASNFNHWSSTFFDKNPSQISVDPFWLFLGKLSLFLGVNSDSNPIVKPVVAFNVTSFGDLTAHYNEGSVFTPADLDKFFYSFIVAAIIGPAMGWILTVWYTNRERKRQLKYLKAFIPIIDDIYIQNYKDQSKCLDLLEQQRKEIISLLQSGILNDVTFRLLNSRIGDYIRKVSIKK